MTNFAIPTTATDGTRIEALNIVANSVAITSRVVNSLHGDTLTKDADFDIETYTATVIANELTN